MRYIVSDNEMPSYSIINESMVIIMQKLQKTKQAVVFLRRMKIWADIKKLYKSQRFRAGRGTMRDRRHIARKGPLVVPASRQCALTR